MPHLTFPTGSIGLVVAILFCWMHRPLDSLEMPLESWVLNAGYSALCDREYRLKYFNNPEHRKAILAGIFFVPPKIRPQRGQKNPEEPWSNEDEDFTFGEGDIEGLLTTDSHSGSSEELWPTNGDTGSSEELLPMNGDTGSSEFLPAVVDIKPSELLSMESDIGSSELFSSEDTIGSSDDIGYPSGEIVEFIDPKQPSQFVYARRRLSKPIARNISGLRDLELRSKGKRLQKFVDHTLLKLQRMINVFPRVQGRRNEVTDLVKDRRIRNRKSRRRKLSNNFNVDEIVANRKKARASKFRGREERNRFKDGRIFGDGKFRSPKLWRQFKQQNEIDDQFQNVRTLNLTYDDRRGKYNTSQSGVSRFLWFQELCKSHRRIVGGRAVESPEELPYVAFVDTGCGGGIISNDWVLTAGHCVDIVPPMYVHVGSVKLMTGCQYNVEHVYIHPRFSRASMERDIALLRINPGFVWSPAVQPIQLSSARAVRRSCGVVAGWGAKEFKGALRIILRRTTLPVVSRRKCKGLGISRNEFCAGYDDAWSDTCQGDSGSPFVVDGIFVGIVSFGYKCAVINTPGVYVDVSFYRQWIHSIAGL